MSVCPITDGTNVVNLARVMLARFLQREVTLFPFVSNKCFAGRYFETIRINLFFIIILPTSFSIRQ